MGCECRDVGLARHCGVLGALDYAADGPDPGREFSGRGDIGLVLVDAAPQHLLAPLHEPSDALGRVPSCRRVRDLPFGEVFGVRRRVQVVPSRLDEHPSQVLVAGLGDAALPHAFSAGVLGGGEPEPCAEGSGVFEPGELAGLENQVRGAHDVDSLEASDGVDPFAPPRLGGLVFDEGLEPLLVLQLLPHGIDVVRKDFVVGPLLEAYGVDPCPMGGGPVALPLPGGSGFAEDQAVPEQELRQPLLAALQVVPCVVQRAHQVARRLAFVVGNPDLDDVSHGEHPGEEFGVVAVVLPPPVGAGLDHLRNRADDAVDAQRRELLLEVEPGDAGLVNAPRGRVEGSHPFGDGRGVVGECGRADLAGHRVEGDGLYRARVHVEADEGGSIQHERAPFHACGVAATGSNQTLAIVGLIHGNCMQQGLSMFLCPAHIVFVQCWPSKT